MPPTTHLTGKGALWMMRDVLTAPVADGRGER